MFKTSIITTVIAAALVSAPLLADDHRGSARSHREHAQSEARWQADAHLKGSMQGVRALTEAYGRGSADDQTLKGVGQAVDGYAGYIVANCKLAPDADAALHAVLHHVTEGADALKRGDARGFQKLEKAHREYSRIFV